MGILLDSGPLGLITNPRPKEQSLACTRWVQALGNRRIPIFLPEIADYEVRRELLRAGMQKSLRRLDSFKLTAIYLPITTEVMLLAAEFWATVRRDGNPTAADHSLDADAIIAAQAAVLMETGVDVVVATTNPRHLTRFVDARLWSEIG